MGSKRIFSLRWRVLLPLIGSMFALVLILLGLQYRREAQIKESNYTTMLNFIMGRILKAHERDTDIKPYLNFIRGYYDHTAFDNIRLSVYDQDGNLIDAIGRELKSPPAEIAAEAAEGETGAIATNADGETCFYRTVTSYDGKITIHGALPWDDKVHEKVKADDALFTLLLLGSLLAVIVLAYLSTNFLMNNIRILREFAHNANNTDFEMDDTKLGHDELGDISRDIIKLYRGKVEAMSESEKEHSVAMHAIDERRRVQRQLTNNINHELKTPVGVIRGYLETVLSADDMDPQTKRYFLTRALDNVERLCSLLNDVSTMTRLEEGSGKIVITEINFHDFVFSIKDDFQQSGLLKKMTFTFDIPMKCTVYANANLLTSTITNLARNATIHSHGTAMGLKLVAESDGFYTFSFWDNGQGVPQEHVPHLFERFYRVEAGRSRKSGGTGLGLPIVKSTIESLGGAVSVFNRSEGGLEFIFTLKKAL